ncbi:MAG: 5'/3'-nucleotidase SurE [Alicyclobacillus sp.]|nr:5'/3'-nucleotidase SurE [Alicyclobacillus sp.]
MRILISNDDGIGAPGLDALVRAVARVGEVVVVAPDRQRSATSHGISLFRPLTPQAHDFGLANVTAYALTGTPADCVKWAVCECAGERGFDVMFSGINEGANLATDVLYSGTVAAAGEAALQGIPAAALSLSGPPWPFEQAAKRACELLERVRWSELGPDNFLNVNIPAKQPLGPFRATILGARTFRDRFERKVDAHGVTSYLYAGEETSEPEQGETDTRALAAGCVSVTPLCYRFTNESLQSTLRGWLAGARVRETGAEQNE